MTRSEGSFWTDAWQDEHKVPYISSSGTSISYDNKRSIDIKVSQYESNHQRCVRFLKLARAWTSRFLEYLLIVRDGDVQSIMRITVTVKCCFELESSSHYNEEIWYYAQLLYKFLGANIFGAIFSEYFESKRLVIFLSLQASRLLWV